MIPTISEWEEKLRQAVSLQRSGQPDTAYRIYQALFPHLKDGPEFLLHMAGCALVLAKRSQARSLVSRCLELAPQSSSAHNLLGAIAMRDRNVREAVTHFETSVACAPNQLESRLNLAEALHRARRDEEAVCHLAKACDIAPNEAHPHYRYGVALDSLGRIAEATEQFRHVLALNSCHGGAWRKLAEYGELTLDRDVDRLRQALSRLEGRGTEQAAILFALALLHEKAGDYDTAFAYFDRANLAVRETLDYDVAADEARMKRIAEIFQPGLFERCAGMGDQSDRMTFVLGMPRSGTTLVEQILAGHSRVSAAGELGYLNNSVHTTSHRDRKRFPRSAARWTRRDIRSIAQRYLGDVENIYPDAEFVTDKMPNNFLYIGVIRIVLPRSTVLHCSRDPIDTCLGNFRQMFIGRLPYSYAQSDLVRYYRAYRKLMDHWRDTVGDAVTDVNYEDLVQNPRPGAERILAACGLDWEDACIDVRGTRRAIYTASSAQIRRGISTDYVESWRRYEKHIGPLIEGLHDL